MSKSPNPDLQALSRRRVVATAGVAGAAAAAVALLPRGEPQPELQAAAPETPSPAAGGGYQATDHVLHYYRTARL